MNDLANVLNESDRCVMCGMCLPHCPTYMQTLDENESPRGRIALGRALLSGDVPFSANAFAHLEHCLSCRACEKICPADVHFGRVIDGIRDWAATQTPAVQRHTAEQFLIDHALLKPRRIAALAWLAYYYQRSGLQRLARAGGLLGRGLFRTLDGLLPDAFEQPHGYRAIYPASGIERGEVYLLTGCVSGVFARDTAAAAIAVLNAAGITVRIPATQACCGALHQHGGHLTGARALAQQNLAVFGTGDTPIISLASGCTATLREYPVLLDGEATSGNAVSRFAHRVLDISEYLVAEGVVKRLPLTAIKARVAVHDPCTLRNVLRAQDTTYTLLRAIPGLNPVPLPGNSVCCGAAGSQLLTRSSCSDALALAKVSAARTLALDFLVTSNIGCELHIGRALREAGETIELVHPVTLLARQLSADR